MRREARTEAESWEAEAEAETRAESWEAEAETRAESWEAEAETRAEAEAAPAAAAAAEASAGAAAKEALEEGRRRAGGRRSACVFCVWEQTASLDCCGFGHERAPSTARFSFSSHAQPRARNLHLPIYLSTPLRWCPVRAWLFFTFLPNLTSALSSLACMFFRGSVMPALISFSPSSATLFLPSTSRC